MKTGITGITMGAGNVLVLKETLKSLSTICDEIIYGDLLLFEDDREILNAYKNEFNLRIVRFNFDYLFNNGFSRLLNWLSSKASNNLVVYLNTSEIIEKDNGVLNIINPEYNCYYFDHNTDPHRWYRFYDKRELQWSGRIHESLVPIDGLDFRPYHKPVFRMADLEKDMGNPFKAQVFNDVKEIVYFRNYMSIVEDVNNLGGTDSGWIKFATENYESMKERLQSKGRRYEAFLNGYFKMYADAVLEELKTTEKFESSNLIEFQGDPKFLGK